MNITKEQTKEQIKHKNIYRDYQEQRKDKRNERINELKKYIIETNNRRSNLMRNEHQIIYELTIIYIL